MIALALFGLAHSLPWTAIRVGHAAAIIIVLVHPTIFGGSPPE